MTQLSFSPVDGKLEATFVASDSNVLQYQLSSSQKVLSIHARIDATMPWVLIKSLVGAPESYIMRIDVPSGVTVKVQTDAAEITAGVLTD